MIVVLLQNAWMPGEESAARLSKCLAVIDCPQLGNRDRSYHLRLTLNTKTGIGWGRILGVDIEDDAKVRLLNTTPVCGVSSGSVLKADSAYVKRVLSSWKPDTILACGVQADVAAAENFSGRVLAIPHPAARFIPRNSDLWSVAKYWLGNAGWSGRKALKIDRETGMVLAE